MRHTEVSSASPDRVLSCDERRTQHIAGVVVTASITEIR